MKTRHWLEAVGWILLLAGLAVLGKFMMSATFMTYDDEGYVLYSVIKFCEGHALYSEVFSQYGPSFYLFYKALHLATGVIYTHDIGRWLTLGYWIGSAGLLGLITRRLGGSVIAGWLAAIMGFLVLIKNICEPFHPGAPLALLSIVAAWAGAECVLRGKQRLMGIWVPAVGMLMLLTKINVGVFIMCAWGSWWLWSSYAKHPRGKTIGWCLALIIPLLPMILMRAHLSTEWGAAFALTFAAGTLALGIQIWTSRPEETSRTDWSWIITAAGILCAVFGIMWILGTSPAELWHGVVVAPLKHPGVYAAPAPTTWLSAMVTILSLIVSVAVLKKAPSTLRTACIVIARLAAIGGFFYVATRGDGWTRLNQFTLTWGPASAVWLLAPLRELPERVVRARQWIGWVFVWQILHAYPVAGSQTGWGSVLWVPVLMMSLSDLIGLWAVRWKFAPWLATAGAAWIATLAVRPTVHNARLWWADSEQLNLPGAKTIYPPPAISKALRVINTNLVEEAGVVVSMPGMLSFNIWSGRPAPIIANTTHWFSLLDEARQNEMVRVLQNDPRAMLVFHHDLINFLANQNIVPSGPLSDYLRRAFTPVIHVGPYDVCVKIGRTIPCYETFKDRNGLITAWIISTSQPSTVSLRSPTRPDWPGIPLSDASWEKGAANRWKLTATMPADWPPSFPREIWVEGEQVRKVIENHAPIP
jgi:heme/copper-type cytochrome/quinol oxidase subunit 4